MYGAGATFFGLEPEPTQFGRSRSRLRPTGPQISGAGTAQKSGGSATLPEEPASYPVSQNCQIFQSVEQSYGAKKVRQRLQLFLTLFWGKINELNLSTGKFSFLSDHF